MLQSSVSAIGLSSRSSTLLYNPAKMICLKRIAYLCDIAFPSSASTANQLPYCSQAAVGQDKRPQTRNAAASILLAWQRSQCGQINNKSSHYYLSSTLH